MFVCGQVATALRGTMAFQETDVAGMAASITKHSLTAEPGDDLAALVDEAFAIASSGRPGPVLLEVPVDVAKAPDRNEPAGGQALRKVFGFAPPRRACRLPRI